MRTRASSLLLVSSILMLLASPSLASGPAPIALEFPRSDADLDHDAAVEVAFIRAVGCVASTVSRLEREGLELAFDRVRRAFADPAVLALVAARTHWTDARGASVPDATVGPRLARAFAAALAPRLFVATLVAYERAGDRPCPTIGAEEVNGFSRDGSRVIALHRPFLERAVHAANPEAGRRVLARALAHEVTHLLGFSHPSALSAVTTESYANTVPVFAGCIALHYPDLDAIRAACGRPDDDALPWSVTCDGRARVAELAPADRVVVRVAAEWVDARVVAVVRDPGVAPRVDVDFELPGVAPRIVDACRVRVRRP